MIDQLKYLTLTGFLALAGATPTGLVARAPPNSGMNICSVQTSSTPGSYCNFRGRVSKPATPLTTSTGGVLADCRNDCLLTSACKSYAYTFKTKTCNLYKVTVDSQKPGANSPNGPTSYSNKQCYTATYYNKLALSNSGFESGKLSPWTTEFVPVSSHSSIKVLAPGLSNSSFSAVANVDNTAASAGDPDLNAYFQQQAYLCEGVNYGFTYSFSPNSVTPASNCSPYIIFFINNPNGTSEYSKAFFIDPSEVTGQFSFGVPFSPDISAMYNVRIQSNACAGAALKIQYDDIQLSA